MNVGRPQRALFIEQFFHPEGWGGAQLPRDITTYLARAGIAVDIVCGSDEYAPVEGNQGADPSESGVRIIRLSALFGGNLHHRKFLRQAWFYAGLLPKLLLRRPPDLFVTQTNPPLAVPLVAVASRLWRRPCMIIAMDVYSEVLAAHGVITRQSVAGRFLARLFSWAYRLAERVVTLGPVMSTRPRSKGVTHERLVEIPTWVTGTPGLLPRMDSRLARLGDAFLRGCDVTAEPAFRGSGIDVAFEAGEYFGARFPIPVLTCVADFQSHHLPRFFSWRARWRTYLGRRLRLVGHRMILRSSQDAERDCHSFYPRSRGRTVVVPFAVPQPEGIVAEPSVPLRHGLPAQYLYLPNQFWKHKSHGVVIDALALASHQADQMLVAASGSPVDHRNPVYYAELQARVAADGVAISFRFLGLVPAQDVPQLALQSVAVINPSLFEGWSTSVEEAKSLGVPLLSSDIAVHREQAGDRARYFAPGSIRSCAEAMLAAWRSLEDAPEQRLASSRASAGQRGREFGQRLAAALERSASQRRAGGAA